MHYLACGWRAEIALVADLERVMHVWYDNLDHDVCVSGDVEYQGAVVVAAGVVIARFHRRLQ